jgi:CRP-like cAMP-binding protein
VGSAERSILLVQSGWFVQRLIHHDGAELIVAFLGRGEVAGLPEMMVSSPAEKETTAGDDSVVISIPWWAITEASVLSSELGARIAAQLAREYSALLDKMATLAFRSLEGRMASFLLEMQPLVERTPNLKLSQGMIAMAVGASRPKVNHCLRNLERRGWIARCNGSIPYLCDPAALQRLR